MRLPVVVGDRVLLAMVSPPAPVVERESLVEGDGVQPLDVAVAVAVGLVVATQVRLSAEVHQGHAALVLRSLQAFGLLLARVLLPFCDRRDRDVVLALAAIPARFLQRQTFCVLQTYRI